MADVEALKAAVLGGDLTPLTLRALADATEKAETEAAERALLVVGRSVRAPRGDGTRCERCLVSDLNGDGTVDVVFEDDGAEATVPAKSAAPLLAFETAAPPPEKDSDAAAANAKARGSALFKEKDWIAASRHYKDALATLKRLYPKSVGATVQARFAFPSRATPRDTRSTGQLGRRAAGRDVDGRRRGRADRRRHVRRRRRGRRRDRPAARAFARVRSFRFFSVAGERPSRRSSTSSRRRPRAATSR